jgi:hypothetical protein
MTTRNTLYDDARFIDANDPTGAPAKGDPAKTGQTANLRHLARLRGDSTLFLSPFCRFYQAAEKHTRQGRPDAHSLRAANRMSLLLEGRP